MDDLMRPVRAIPLTRGQVTIIDPEDWPMVSGYKWHVRSNRRASGSVNGPYAVTNIHIMPKVRRADGRGYRMTVAGMHRVLVPGAVLVDHHNGDGLDNRRANLRATGYQENRANAAKAMSHGGRAPSSRYKGVARRKDRYRAYIRVRGKLRHLGHFADEADAARAYDAAAGEAFGEYASLNLPPGGQCA